MRPGLPAILAMVAANALAGPASASAQVRAGGEFRVNPETARSQAFQAAADLGGGRFIIVWTNADFDGSGDVEAQRYTASGSPDGPAFYVNSYTVGSQISHESAVAADGRGGFVVAWDAQQEPGGGVFARRFDRAGAPVGLEFRVNAYTTGMQSDAAVAALTGGSFVVVWHSPDQDGSGLGIFARRIDASGALGAEFQVNTYTTGTQLTPRVASAPDGRFVVTWTSIGQDGSAHTAMGRLYDATGTPLTGEIQLNSNTLGTQERPVASMTPAGFVAAWHDSSGIDTNVVARRFGPSGAPLGPEFPVNTYTPFSQVFPWIAADEQGGFIVAWGDSTQDAGTYGVFARRFDTSAVPRSGEFRVNTYTPDRQWFPVVASDAVGNFVVTWMSQYQDGSLSGVYAQRFGGLVPAALAVDSAANQVLEPGETVDVRPSWRNVNGSAQAFSAALASFSGPTGAVYSIVDGSGSYGTVANGATAQCVDCYVLAVSPAGPRPAVHWDGAFVEAISPDAQGQRKVWALHVGESFEDVPRTNGFYRSIETLLHQSVTGGCTATAYCPASSTTREQMAAFVLLSREGSGYSPVPCGTPVFADVPAESPFCRFVEELSRRGVAAGCGGGNYCPQEAVTREQMAVFVLRTLDPTLIPPACTVPMFADVPASSPFCRWIEELARRGVATGCGGGNYCPGGVVTREQMAVFLVGTFGLTLYGP